MDILQTTRQFLSDQYGIPPETITPDTKLDSVGLDSLAFIDLLFEFEDKYSIHTSDEEIGKLNTIGEFIALVEEKRQNSTS